MYLFSEDLEEPLYLYETVMRLAEHTQDRDIEFRIWGAFDHWFEYAEHGELMF